MATMDKVKKVFLISMISLFILAGVVGAIFFLLGTFNDMAGKILGTIGVLFLYSLFGLVSSKILAQKGNIRYLAIAGLIFSTIAVVLILPMIWGWIYWGDEVGKIIASTSILAFSIAHISLLSGKMKNTYTKASFWTTTILILIVAIMLVWLIVGEIWNTEGVEVFLRFLGFFGILDVSGTIVTPLLRRLKG